MWVINGLGVALIVLTVWWFWLYKPTITNVAADEVEIIVANGVYSPARIQLKAGATTTLKVLRQDASPCAAILQIPDANISEELPLNQVQTITLPAMPAGEHPFHCQMQMYRGLIVVK